MDSSTTPVRSGLATACLLLVLATGFLSSNCSVVAQMPVVSVGTIVGLGAAVGGLAERLLDEATGEVRSLIEEIHRLVEELTTRLSDTYRGLLDTTLDQLGEETRKGLEAVYSTFQKLFSELHVGIATLSAQLLSGLRDTLLGVRIAIAQAEEAAHSVVSEALDVAVFIVALILFGVVLLIAARIIVSGRLARAGRGRAIVAALLIVAAAVSGALLFEPGRRAVYRLAGLKLLEPLREATIFEVRPSTIVVGRTKEVLILGTALAPDGTLGELAISGVPLTVRAADHGVVAADLTNVDLSGHTGAQTLRLRSTSEDAHVATAVVRIESRRPLPRVVAWTITPIGARWESRGSTTRRNIGCEAPRPVIGETRSCSFSELIIVPQDQGHVLDVSRVAQLGEGAGDTVANDEGDARAGFREVITTYRPRNGRPRYPRREINYHPDASRPIGIRVTGRARNDVRTDPDAKRAEFRADYTVHARWRNPDSSARTWTFNGACDISGTVTCGTYPYPQELSAFAGDMRHLVDVTFRGADGTLQHRNATLTPGAGSAITVPLTFETPEGTLATAAFTLQMIQNAVRVSGPQITRQSLLVVVAPQLRPALERLRARSR